MSENTIGFIGVFASFAWAVFIIFASRYTYPTKSKSKYIELIEKHGTLEEFTEAVRKAETQLFCTKLEADIAIKNYKDELAASNR